MIPDPEVHIVFPWERLKHMTPSYKSIAEYIVISANLAGELVFTASDGVQQTSHYKTEEPLIAERYQPAEKAHVETRFTKLHNPDVMDERRDNEEEERPLEKRRRERPEAFASVLVRVADVQKFLQVHCVGPSNVICSMFMHVLTAEAIVTVAR